VVVFGIPFWLAFAAYWACIHLFAVSAATITLSLRRTHGFVFRRRSVLLALLHVFRREHVWDLPRFAI
jgi:hypothetical protein